MKKKFWTHHLPLRYSLFAVEAEQVIQGRRLKAEDIGLVRHWLATEPAWNRSRLSRELCARWNWRKRVLINRRL